MMMCKKDISRKPWRVRKRTVILPKKNSIAGRKILNNMSMDILTRISHSVRFYLHEISTSRPSSV